MSEQIKVEELIGHRSWLTAAIMDSLGRNIDNYNIIPGETKEITVSLLINGKETNLRNFFKHCDKEFEAQLEAEAGAILRDRICQDAYKRIDSIKKMIKKCEVELFENYFPDDKEFNETRWDDQ